MKKLPKADAADILLLLEGTFPYVNGGVSSWVSQLMQQFPQYTFAIIFLGSARDDYDKMVYELPDNLVHLETHFLFDKTQTPSPKSCKSAAGVKQSVKEFHDWMRCPHHSASYDYQTLFDNLTYQLCESEVINLKQFLFSEDMWELLQETYDEHCPEIPFTDYFWHIRNMHYPLWSLVSIAKNIPKAKIFHTVSTGYAGFLGALLHHLYKKPLILSEHGIYTKERRIDLLKNQSLFQKTRLFISDDSGHDYISKLWLRFFSSLGRICYLSSSEIISLFDVSREVQILGGADEHKTKVIPNGINAEKFAHMRDATAQNQNHVVAFIGRVVPIKDLKTFIRSIRVVVNALPKLEAWIVGPDDEDPEYANECKQLVKTMNLENNIVFTGHQNITEILPKIKLLVLSSISEGLPLVILEAFSAGIPVVTTRVGACEAMINGSLDLDEDKALGMAGRVVDIANPSAMAKVIAELLIDERAWRSAAKAAVNRVTQFYDQDTITQHYADIYQNAMENEEWPA